MGNQTGRQPACPLVQIDSCEPLWEWDPATDALLFTKGACRLLKLGTAPSSMSEFYRLLHPQTAMALAQVRQECVSGKRTRLQENEFYFQGQHFSEYIFALSRDQEGKAKRLLGRLEKTSPAIGNDGANPTLAGSGLWIWEPVTGRVWRDGICSAILGPASGETLSGFADPGFINIHPNELATLRRHYSLFRKGKSQGDTITDIVRILNPLGEYVPLLIRASAVERDARDEAILITGIMALNARDLQLNTLNQGDRLYQAMNSLNAGQWNWDTRLKTLTPCARYLSVLGYGPERSEEFSHHWRDFIHPDDRDKLENSRDNIIPGPEKGDTFECTYRMLNADGSWAWIFDRGCVTWRDQLGRAGQLVGSITDISSAQAERDQLEDLVRHDSLTGLRSRASCKLEMERIEHKGIRPVSVVSVDITGLKMINDNLGHAFGDKILTRAANILRSCLRTSDFIARIGGDEFLILLRACNQKACGILLKKIEGSFEKFNKAPGRLPVFAACGAATTADLHSSLIDIISLADQRMYERKRIKRTEQLEAIRAWIRKRTGKEPQKDERVGD